MLFPKLRAIRIPVSITLLQVRTATHLRARSPGNVESKNRPKRAGLADGRTTLPHSQSPGDFQFRHRADFLKVMKAIALGLVLFVHACEAHEQERFEDLVRQLECGMSIMEVENVAGRRVETTNSKPDLGTHLLRGKSSSAWLTFRDDHLQSVITGRIDGLTSVRLSPKKNICTGELVFFLSIEWVETLQGSDIFWDGEVVEKGASSGLILEVSSGNHELRIVTEGYEPIVKQIHLGPQDSGRQDILITGADLKPVQR